MNKRLGRNILYGLSVLALCGVLLYGARLEPAPEDAAGERGSANAALLAQLEEEAVKEADEAQGERMLSEGYEEIALEIEVPGGDQEVLLFRQEEQIGRAHV